MLCESGQYRTLDTHLHKDEVITFDNQTKLHEYGSRA
jgi:hypothetical protein